MIDKVVVYTCVGLAIAGTIFYFSTVKHNYFDTHLITSFMYQISTTLHPSMLSILFTCITMGVKSNKAVFGVF